MTEEKTIARNAPVAKPSLWDQALRAVKGDSTTELVEQFTQEMTLVAEGLCEDQARLRRAVDGLIRQSEQMNTSASREYGELRNAIEENARETQHQLTQLSRRLEVLEAAHQKEQQRKKPGKLSLLQGDLIGRLTLLVSIVCGTWLAVTVLKLFM